MWAPCSVLLMLVKLFLPLLEMTLLLMDLMLLESPEGLTTRLPLPEQTLEQQSVITVPRLPPS